MAKELKEHKLDCTCYPCYEKRKQDKLKYKNLNLWDFDENGRKKQL